MLVDDLSATVLKEGLTVGVPIPVEDLMGQKQVLAEVRDIENVRNDIVLDHATKGCLGMNLPNPDGV
jgi:hypothetical protein